MQLTIDALAGYRTADVDEGGDIKYYGFTGSLGRWYILREWTSAGTFRYTSGTTGYATAWTDRAAQSYDYFHLSV